MIIRNSTDTMHVDLDEGVRGRSASAFSWKTFPSAKPILLFLLCVMSAACKLPDSGPDSAAAVAGGGTYVANSAAEAAASHEYAQLAAAVATGSRVPRTRYTYIIDKYPTTHAAYEANIDLARLDYDSIQAQKATARTNIPVAESSKRFLDTFAYGDHAHPPMPDLQQRYRSEMQPLYFEAVKNIGTWQATLEYLAAYPDNPYADDIERSIEAAILNPRAGWEARDIVNTYAEIRPDRVRELQLAPQVESNIYQTLHEGLPFESLEKFLSLYPGSIYFPNVESMIKRQLSRQVTVYSDRSTLEEHVSKRPGSVEGMQATTVLEELDAQAAAYRTAASRGTVEALEEFIAANPKNRYLNEAAKRIEAIKLASVSSAEQARLRSFQAQIDQEMRTEESQLLSYKNRVDNLTKEIASSKGQIRALQVKSNDLMADAREQRRLATQAARTRDQLRNLMKRNPDMAADFEKKKAEHAAYIAEGNRLEKEANDLSRQVANLKTSVAERDAELSALREEAKAAQVVALGKRNRLHHEYLARLDAAWNASRGR